MARRPGRERLFRENRSRGSRFPEKCRRDGHMPVAPETARPRMALTDSGTMARRDTALVDPGIMARRDTALADPI